MLSDVVVVVEYLLSMTAPKTVPMAKTWCGATFAVAHYTHRQFGGTFVAPAQKHVCNCICTLYCRQWISRGAHHRPTHTFASIYRSILTLTRRCSVATYEFSLCTMAATMWRRFSCCCVRPSGGVDGSASVGAPLRLPGGSRRNMWTASKRAEALRAADDAVTEDVAQSAVSMPLVVGLSSLADVALVWWTSRIEWRSSSVWWMEERKRTTTLSTMQETYWIVQTFSHRLRMFVQPNDRRTHK